MITDTTHDRTKTAPGIGGSLSRFRNLLRSMDDALDSARRRRLGLDALVNPQPQPSGAPLRTKATKIVRGA